MKPSHHNRGIIAPALLLVAAVAIAGYAQGTRNGKYQEPTVRHILPDPAAQRREMITALTDMQKHLSIMEKSLQNLEKINGAILRLQFESQKRKPTPPLPAPTPVQVPQPPDGGNGR